MPTRAIIIDGQTIPRRRFTVWAWVYFLLYFALPVLAIAAAADYVLYSIFFT